MTTSVRPFRDINDTQWLDILIRSVREPVIDGIEMPRFPHGNTQRNFVGSADADALREAFTFYQNVKGYAGALGREFHPNMKVLDFGCGWGRLARFFWRDVGAENVFGVDTDPEMIAVCKHLGVLGSFAAIEPAGTLPYEDRYFDVLLAYSVFTHLPETTADHWMRELNRVAGPGCVFFFTVEPRRFLTFIQTLDESADSLWHAGLARHKESTPALLEAFDRGEFCYLPTGGGAFRDAQVYGDAVIPKAYLESRWGDLFRTVSYVDDPAAFWQAFVAAIRV